MLVIYSFILSISIQAASLDWQKQVDTIMSGEGDVSSARQILNSMRDLDATLNKALDRGGQDERQALAAIRLLPKTSMVDELLKRLNSMEISSQRAQVYFVTLASMMDSDRGDKIVKALTQKIDLTSQGISPSLRIALLSGMSLRGESHDPKILSKMLDDPSYDLRLKVMEISQESVQKDPEGHREFLGKALTMSPYPVRLKAVDAIAGLPFKIRRNYRLEVLKCAKTDANDLVKKTCAQVQF
jgi:hypothetical protein